MSHGSDKACEPNLVPLLDMVLQLVMFFMVCANFVMEQVNESIKLPTAVSAQPLDPNAGNIIFLNVNEKGEVLLSALDAVGSDRVLYNQIQVQSYMKRRYEEDVRVAGGDTSKPPRSTVIIRADRRTQFRKIYDIEVACQKAGYKNCKLRAIRDGAKRENN